MSTCQKSPLRGSTIPKELYGRSSPSKATVKGDESLNRLGSGILDFQGLDLGSALALTLTPDLALALSPSTKKILKKFMQTYIETVRNPVQLYALQNKPNEIFDRSLKA